MNRWTLYWLANLAFALIVLIGSVRPGSSGSIHPVYLIPLFALCTHPLTALRALNDRFGLLALFGFIYFVFYGALDVVQLLFGEDTAQSSDGTVITETEALILVGGLLLQLGYYAGCALARATEPLSAPVRDWPERSLVVWGTLLWIVSTYMTWQLRVHVLVDTSIETTNRGYGSLSALELEATLLASYMQPMGIMILAYAYSVYRRRLLLMILLAAIAFEMMFGLVTDTKGQVLIGVILVVLCKVLVDGKLPKAWLGLMAAIIILVFPILQANRIAMGMRGLGHDKAAADITATLAHALEAQDELASGRFRAESFLERSSMKRLVTMIVERTGDTVTYQEGHTLFPLLTAFIPRLVWPDKPDVQVGQLVNKEFHVSDQAATNISPSHLGELYWNFGWLGVICGMPLIGALLGVIAARFDLSRATSLTRLLVLAITIRTLMLGFESVISIEYSVWMRTMLVVALLHILLARRVTPATDSATPDTPTAPAAVPRYPNLLA